MSSSSSNRDLMMAGRTPVSSRGRVTLANKAGWAALEKRDLESIPACTSNSPEHDGIASTCSNAKQATGKSVLNSSRVLRSSLSEMNVGYGACCNSVVQRNPTFAAKFKIGSIFPKQSLAGPVQFRGLRIAKSHQRTFVGDNSTLKLPGSKAVSLPCGHREMGQVLAFNGLLVEWFA